MFISEEERQQQQKMVRRGEAMQKILRSEQHTMFMFIRQQPKSGESRGCGKQCEIHESEKYPIIVYRICAAGF